MQLISYYVSISQVVDFASCWSILLFFKEGSQILFKVTMFPAK